MLQHQYAGILLFSVAFFGMCLNWFIVLFIQRMESLRNAFGRLLSTQALGEAILLTLFALFVAPAIFFQITEWVPASQKVGHMLLICYDVCIYVHLIISLNRLCAISLPFYYDRIFTHRATTALMAFAWAVAVLPTFYYYIIADCRIYLVLEEWHFTFTTAPECQTIVWFADFIKYNTIVAIIVVIDLLTISRVHSFNKMTQGNRSHEYNLRRKSELNFLKQALLQGFAFLLELITYFILPQFFTDKWTIFLLTTMSWALVHSADGVITIFYNRELRNLFLRKIRVIHNRTSNAFGEISGTRRSNASRQTNTNAQPELPSYPTSINKSDIFTIQVKE